ncbi:DsbA family protein [Haloglycomyces albus]|uniref:DsbA family protein n=1 Tax=Haloglycomyces albus TaxID=526067 RepID=UPI00046CACB6|nr:DsbA family protein [Haloglycomyces albus]
MRMEVWADVISPWTFILKRRLDDALGNRDDIEVIWRPVTVDPTAPERAVPLVENFLSTPMDTAEVEPYTTIMEGMPTARQQTYLARIAADAGIGPRFGALWRINSDAAQRLLHLAYTDGGPTVQNDVMETLLQSYHVAGDDISDHDVLASIAREAGFPGGGALLDGDLTMRDYHEQKLRGQGLGVEASPTIVHHDHVLKGAVNEEDLTEFLNALPEPPEVPEERERLRLAESLLRQRNPLGALTLVEPVLAEHPEQSDILEVAARAYFGSAQMNKARALAERLVDQNPADFYAHHLLGRTLVRLGRKQEGQRHLRLAGEDDLKD